jgi:hypothetical protein
VEHIGTPPVAKAVVYGREDERGLVLNATRRGFSGKNSATTTRGGSAPHSHHDWAGAVSGTSVDTLAVKVLPPSAAKAPKPVPAPPVEEEAPLPDDPDWETADAE